MGFVKNYALQVQKDENVLTKGPVVGMGAIRSPNPIRLTMQASYPIPSPKYVFAITFLTFLAGMFFCSANAQSLTISGPHSVAHQPFTVLKPGEIRAEVSWTGNSKQLRVRLQGRKAGSYAETQGQSPLVLKYVVTGEDVRRGVNWRIVIDDPAGIGDARISVKLDLPEDADARADFERRKVALRTGSFAPAAEREAEFLDRLAQSEGEGLHGLIMLNRAVTRSEIKVLERKGIVRQSFLGGWNSIGLIKRGFNRNDPDLANLIAAVLPLGPRDKVHPDLWVANYQAFDILVDGKPSGNNPVLNRDGTLKVLVQFYPDVPRKRVLEIFRQGAKVLSAKSDRLWEVNIEQGGLSELASQDEVEWIGPGSSPKLLENATTRNVVGVTPVQGAAVNAASNTIIYSGLSGAGITIGIDDNGVDGAHNDLNVVRDVSGVGSHGTHVAGIAAGSGVQSALADNFGNPNGGAPFQWRGMAPRAGIVDWGSLVDAANTLDAITNNSMDVVNHSHALGQDGNYDTRNQLIDQMIRGGAVSGGTAVPRIPRCFSSGNGGGNAAQYGNQFGYFANTKQMKNALLVGNWVSATGLLAAGSSMGPAYDGRIMPTVVAPGTNITSCNTNSNGYRLSGGGTSMAAPVVTGMHALLLESWQNTYSSPLGTTVDAVRPLPSTLRAIVIQTSTDIINNNVRGGSNNEVDSDSNPANGNDGNGTPTATAGPDYSTGWGLVNAQAAVNLLEDHRLVDGVPVPNRFVQDTVNQGAVEEFEFVLESNGLLQITLAWDDIEAAVQSPATSPLLINDLDLELVSPQGVVFYPWQLGQTILDSAGNPIANEDQVPGTSIQVQIPIAPTITPSTNSDYVPQDALTGAGAWVAGTGRDHLNNVEQVSIPNAVAGRWTARVIGFNVPTGAQDFSLVGMPYPDLPELVGSNEEQVGIPGFNTDITFDWSVSNIGTAGTGVPFEYTVLLSTDFQLGGDVPLVIQGDSVSPDGTIGALAAGGSVDISTTVQITPAQASALLGIPSGSVTVADLVENDVFLLVYYDSAGAVPEHEEVNIIPLQAARLVDVVLVMDRSGSMGANVPVSNGTQTKIAQLKKSANLFLDLMRTNEGDRLGEISFASTATIDFDEPGAAEVVTELTSGPGGNLGVAKSEVNALAPGGATNIRDALQAGLDLLPPGSDRRKVLVFLSDGMKTAGGDPSDPAFLNQFAAQDVKVYAVGFGTEGGSGLAGLDLNLLSTLATQGSGGLFHVAENSTQLDKFFIEAVGGAIESELVVDPEGDLAPGRAVEVDAGLGSKDLNATFIATWDEPTANVELSLRSPSGLLITEANAASFGGKVEFTRRPGYVFAKVSPPLPTGPSVSHAGTWSMIIRNQGRVTTRYMANVLADSTAHFSVATPIPAGRDCFEPGDEIEFSALLKGAAPGALARAVITVQPFVPAAGIGEVFASKGLTGRDFANVPLAINKEPLSQLERIGMAYQGKFGAAPVTREPATPFTLSLGDLMKDSALFRGSFIAPVPGEYSFLIRASALDENCEPINREILRTVRVVPKVNSKTTELVVDSLQDSHLVMVTPRDRGQGRIGPGYADGFTLKPEGLRILSGQGEAGRMQDQLNGNYVLRVVPETGQGGVLRVSFQGVELPALVIGQGGQNPGPVATPAGQQVEVALAPDISLQFERVLAAGETVLKRGEGPDSLRRLQGAVPATFGIVTSADLGPHGVEVMVQYDEANFGSEGNLILAQKQEDAWVEITTELDVSTNVISGRASSLSEFAVLEIIPPKEVGQLDLGRSGTGELQITTPAGSFYYLQYTESLERPWKRISPAFNGRLPERDPVRRGLKRGFYRLELRPSGR